MIQAADVLVNSDHRYVLFLANASYNQVRIIIDIPNVRHSKQGEKLIAPFELFPFTFVIQKNITLPSVRIHYYQTSA